MQNYYSNWTKTPKQNVSASAENDWKLLNDIRADIISEFEAINQYTNHINGNTNPEMIKYWKSIRAEEEMHIGELMSALFRLDHEFHANYEKGVEENK